MSRLHQLVLVEASKKNYNFDIASYIRSHISEGGGLYARAVLDDSFFLVDDRFEGIVPPANGKHFVPPLGTPEAAGVT